MGRTYKNGILEKTDQYWKVAYPSEAMRDGYRTMTVPIEVVALIRAETAPPLAAPMAPKTATDLAEERAEAVVASALEKGYERKELFNEAVHVLGRECGIKRGTRERDVLCGIVADEITRQTRAA